MKEKKKNCKVGSNRIQYGSGRVGSSQSKIENSSSPNFTGRIADSGFEVLFERNPEIALKPKMENPSSSETSEISSVIHPNDGVQRQDHAVLPEVLEHRYVCFLLYSLLEIFEFRRSCLLVRLNFLTNLY